MLLTDHDIKKMAQEKKLLKNYTPQNIKTVCYDLRSEYFCTSKEDKKITCKLEPGESIFVQCKEGIELPENMVARVHLRNSRIRQGLSLDAPIYYPGHKTIVYFRMTNVSNSIIRFHTNDEIASITFEQLESTPDETYTGTFQNEIDFDGMANYTNVFQANMEEIDEKRDDIKHIERNIYANVITIITIFIGLFTLVNVNVSFISDPEITTRIFVIFNLTTIGSLSFLAALLRSFFDHRNTKVLWIWIVPAVAFALSILLYIYS